MRNLAFPLLLLLLLPVLAQTAIRFADGGASIVLPDGYEPTTSESETGDAYTDGANAVVLGGGPMPGMDMTEEVFLRESEGLAARMEESIEGCQVLNSGPRKFGDRTWHEIVMDTTTDGQTERSVLMSYFTPNRYLLLIELRGEDPVEVENLVKQAIPTVSF